MEARQLGEDLVAVRRVDDINAERRERAADAPKRIAGLLCDKVERLLEDLAARSAFSRILKGIGLIIIIASRYIYQQVDLLLL